MTPSPDKGAGREQEICIVCGKLKRSHRMVKGELLCYPDTFPDQPMIFRGPEAIMGTEEPNTSTDNLRSNQYELPPIEFLPCPFCGSTVLTLDHLTEPDDWFVSCNRCEVQQIAKYFKTEAIAAWNTRK